MVDGSDDGLDAYITVLLLSGLAGNGEFVLSFIFFT